MGGRKSAKPKHRKWSLKRCPSLDISEKREAVVPD